MPVLLLTKPAMVAAWKDARPLPDQRTDAAAKALARAPIKPGRFLYSNLGYILIGAAIERIVGVPYESALRSHVLEPLGITSGSFGPPPGLWGHAGRLLPLGPLGALDIGRGGPADPGDVESDNPAVMAPAGRLHLTLEDADGVGRLQRRSTSPAPQDPGSRPAAPLRDLIEPSPGCPAFLLRHVGWDDWLHPCWIRSLSRPRRLEAYSLRGSREGFVVAKLAVVACAIVVHPGRSDFRPSDAFAHRAPR